MENNVNPAPPICSLYDQVLSEVRDVLNPRVTIKHHATTPTVHTKPFVYNVPRDVFIEKTQCEVIGSFKGYRVYKSNEHKSPFMINGDGMVINLVFLNSGMVKKMTRI